MDFDKKFEKLGFAKSDNENTLISNTEYKIKLNIDKSDIKKSTIDYGTDIKIWNKTTSNFKQPENFVVLECVIRLLKKGYPANCIELEKTWKSGHGTSGRLDILLKDTKRKTYALIECKTWGEEYAKERNNMIEDGGQLFSYLVQEKETKLLILYSSNFQNEIKFTAEAIDCNSLKGSNNQELFDSWDKSFILESIFAENSTLYFSQKRNLLKKDLKELDQETGRGLFNSFAEILRRYAISDKSNAFNKIFNLFVCKIYDEDIKNFNEELDFQWKINDSFENIIERLSNLYQKGLKDYLQIEIQSKFFLSAFEFYFIDIYNSETYNKNYSIIKEIVELLQTYQIKYTAKHQFLGDFFEDLLNTGVKQEAGQFFTPTPLARFILKSIPINKIITKKIEDKNPEILPYIIDYACGAGHFLTEAIDEIEQHINNIEVTDLVGRIQKHFLSIKENFFWAKEFVYGIEKDYRLAKTTKVAMFLYGDGDAIILNADGLDDFYTSKDFTGVLKTNAPAKKIEKFDIIVSNPPFSISNFKQDLKNGEKNFSFYKYISPKSAEIECLFVERINHLLVESGIAGIILPLSILNNESKIYTETRKMLLLHFNIIAIVELRDKTFKPTNTTTVSLFLKKRKKSNINSCFLEIYEFCNNQNDNSILAQLIIVKTSLLEIFRKNNLTDLTIPITNFDEFELNNELVSIAVNYMNYNNKTVIAYSGEKKEQEAFLGYRYSKSRGRDGFEILKNDNGNIETALFDETDLMNNNKINAHIQANFENLILSIPETLQDNLSYVSTNTLLQKQNFVLHNPSSFFISDNYIIQSNSQLGDIIDNYELKQYQLSDLIINGDLKYFGGLTYNKKAEVPRKTNKKVLTASNLDLQTGKLDLTTKLIYLDENYELPEELNPKINDIIISNSSGSLKHLGKVVYITEDHKDCAVGGFLSIIRCKDEKLAKALFYRFLSFSFRKHIATLRGQNINNLDLDKIKNFDLYLPTDLEKFHKEITKKETELQQLNEKLKKMKI